MAGWGLTAHGGVLLFSVGTNLQRVLAICVLLAKIWKYERFAGFWQEFAEGIGGLLGNHKNRDPQPNFDGPQICLRFCINNRSTKQKILAPAGPPLPAFQTIGKSRI